MEQRGGAFSHHRPYTPDHVRAIENFRDRERKERQSAPQLETLPTNQDAEEYIERYRLHTDESRRKHEQALTKRLAEAIFLQQPEAIKALRREIWMISNHVHHTSEVPSETSEEILRSKIRELRETPVEHLGESATDIAERTRDHENEIQEWLSILGALRQRLTGKELVDALSGKESDELFDEHNSESDPLADFEYHFEQLMRESAHYHDNRRKDGRRKLEDMRIVRDRLYFDLLYPEQAKLKYRLEQKERSKRN